MKPSAGCKLFGAQQAVSGIRDAVTLLHSVVGCHFGSLSFHLPCDMTQIRQGCTVISDSDVVFSGEASLARALRQVEDLYSPQVIFVLSGCVSDMIQDDIDTAAREHRGRARVIPVEAAGYRGRAADGYEAGLLALADLMEPQPKTERPAVNLLGFGADDPHAVWDIEALRELLGERARLGTVFSRCDIGQIRQAPAAGLNLVLGRGEELAKVMRERFSIPYEVIDYPYGLTGAAELWAALGKHFGLDFSAEKSTFEKATAAGLLPAYARLQALYGMPAAIIADGARSRGMARFLTRELGMEVVLCAEREQTDDLEDFHNRVCSSEAAVLFGSSFEMELADELDIPLLRIDYPVFDRVCVTRRPYLGAEGTLCLAEDLLNEIMAARRQKGALYQ